MRKKKLLVAVGIGLVALEAALQLGAIALHFLYRAPSLGPSAEVVCLGDSYTAGIGASTPEASYPAQLERRLAAAGRPVHVANGGMPGQDSAFMLRRLPSLLRPETKVLCVLMAFNDTWSRPPRVDLATIAPGAEATGFQWRWRTGRLLALSLRFATNSWFRTGGDVPTTEPPMPGATTSPDQLFDLAAGFAGLDALGITAADEPPPTAPIEPDAAVRAALADVERRIVNGAARDALPAAEALVNDERARTPALKYVAIAAHVLGDAAKETAAMERLEAAVTAGDLAAMEARLAVLLATGRADRAAAAAKELIAREPRSLAGWIVAQDATYALGRTAEFVELAPRAMRIVGRTMPPETATMARHFADLVAPKEPERAAHLLVAAGLLDGNTSLARARLTAVRGFVSWANLASALDAATTDAARRERWRTLLRATYDEADDAAPWAATLEDHLLQIGAACRARGIRLVVLSYPFAHPRLEDVQRRAAARLGAPFVFVRERFDHELTTKAWDDLFVKNGHCNDAGYAIVAEMAAAAVADALK